jgi:hypothetical protein
MTYSLYWWKSWDLLRWKLYGFDTSFSFVELSISINISYTDTENY